MAHCKDCNSFPPLPPRDDKRARLMIKIWDDIDYWEKVGDRDCRGKMEGLAFSILATLDGCTSSCPGFAVIPMDGTENISGSLHEVFYSYRPE